MPGMYLPLNKYLVHQPSTNSHQTGPRTYQWGVSPGFMRIPECKDVPTVATAIKFLNTSELGSSKLYPKVGGALQSPQMPANDSACWRASGLHWDGTLCLFRACACETGEWDPNQHLTTSVLHMNSCIQKHCCLANSPHRPAGNLPWWVLTIIPENTKFQTLEKYGRKNPGVCWSNLCELHYGTLWKRHQLFAEILQKPPFPTRYKPNFSTYYMRAATPMILVTICLWKS